MSGPYADAAVDLYAAGWSPIPLPFRQKEPPRRDFTGAAGFYASRADVEAWREERGDGNVAIRLPPGVLGLDVDAYKGGAATLADREREWGPPPPAPYPTSRDDGSGIRLYRVPEGLAWRDTLAGVDLIHAGHRYVIVPPSVHPEGRTYRWERPDGGDKVPRVDELPELPERWVAELSKPARAAASADLHDEEVTARLLELPSGPACRLVATTVARAVAEVRSGGSRHNIMRDGMARLVRWGERGHPGVPGALAELRAAFVAAVNGEPGRDTSAEWARALTGAVQLVLGDPSEEGDKGCDCGGERAGEEAPSETPRPAVAPVTLAEAHETFARWLGEDYDLDALDAVLGTVAAERLDGDPAWLLLVSGSGNTKTETVSACAGAGATVTSTITSEGALLSATGRKDRARDATGGLLRKLGVRGVLVIKDVTSILSLSRDARASVLAALREVADGYWERNVGADGGRSLTWRGRLVVIGAVTTAWDSAHGAVAAMGDRFALVRMDSTAGRVAAGRQALRNVGSEETMRAELAEAVGGCLAGMDASRAVLAEETVEKLLVVANLVTLARTAVERDYRGDVVNAHAPEMPTRFAKMLAQIARGLLAIGADQDHALAVALRVASDSLPPLRRQVLLDVWRHPASRTTDVQRRRQKPRTTIDRTLQELHVLGLLVQAEAPLGWQYTIGSDVDTAALESITRKGTRRGLRVEEERSTEGEHLYRGSAKSGDDDDHPRCLACGAELFLVRDGRGLCAKCGIAAERPRAAEGEAVS